MDKYNSSLLSLTEEKQQKYYRMVQRAKGEDRRKSEVNHKIKQLLHRIPTNEYIGECILKLCQNLIRKKGFIEFNKTHGDDMISKGHFFQQ